MDYSIDEIKIEEIDSLITIYDEAFDKNSDIETIKTNFLNVINNRNTKILVIKFKNNVAGFIKYDIIEELFSKGKPYMFLSNLCIESKYRGNGLSKKLLERVEEDARKRNCEYIFLTCGNQRYCAHNLYKQLGYTIRSSKIFRKDL